MPLLAILSSQWFLFVFLAFIYKNTIIFRFSTVQNDAKNRWHSPHELIAPTYWLFLKLDIVFANFTIISFFSCLLDMTLPAMLNMFNIVYIY